MARREHQLFRAAPASMAILLGFCGLAGASGTAMEDGRLPYTFSYPAEWIAVVTPEHESVEFSLHGGTIMVRIYKKGNGGPDGMETLADELKKEFDRVGVVRGFSRKPQAMPFGRALRLSGTLSHYGEESKFILYVFSVNGARYVLRYNGPFHSAFYAGFLQITNSLRFKPSGQPVKQTPESR